MSDPDNEYLEKYLDEKVVIDTPTPFVYLGTLREIKHGNLVLENADVHDSRTSKSTKEVYIMNAAENGIRVNRKEVALPKHRLLSISFLEDVVKY